MSDCKVIVLFIQKPECKETATRWLSPSLTSLTEVHTDLGKLP